MSKRSIASPDCAPPTGHFPHGTVAPSGGRLVFVSGTVARDKQGNIVGVGDVTAQTHQTLQNVISVVESAGGAASDITRVEVYVRDIADAPAINAVRRQYFPQPPASAMVEVSMLVRDEYLVEISAIAVVDPA